MRIQAYNAYNFTLVVTAATRRPEGAPSTRFTAATIHEDYCARVRALLKEHKHCTETALTYPAAQRIQTYFPKSAGSEMFAVRQLLPAGSPRDIDPEWMLEIMRIRYEGMLVLLPAAHTANENEAAAIERHIEYAVKKLFEANNVPHDFIPGDNDLRPEGGTSVDIICELGAATSRTGVDIPGPAAA